MTAVSMWSSYWTGSSSHGECELRAGLLLRLAQPDPASSGRAGDVERLELVELCHSDTIKASPFFNIFANINLRMFSQSDARRLISQSLSGTTVEFSDGELEQLFDLAGAASLFSAGRVLGIV